MNTWSRPFEGHRASAEPAGGHGALAGHHYFAFLSYSHHDTAEADWLHKELESFRVPSSLAGRLTGNGVVPKRLSPIFRDRHELAAAHDLGSEIRQALEHSRCLIVLCSPAAATSKWVNAEIDQFKRVHPEGCIIAAIVAGDPTARAAPGTAGEQCFPPALRQKYDRRGRPTAKKAEPLAADIRGTSEDRRIGFLKIVAGILGVGLDDLVQRDHLRRQRRLAFVSAGSLAGMVVAGSLAFTAIHARDEARDQRREAESLVEFMVGDLKDKLEPIGRLDVLDGVGSRVLNYYGSQDTSQLSDQALAQRSNALSLMANVAQQRGNTDRALRLYRAAMAGTAESVRRNPTDPERLFDHAQNVFYVGEIEKHRGNVAAAESGMREYKRLADQMIALDPNNIRWRMEEQYATADLGIVLVLRRRFAEAEALLQQSLNVIDALSTTDPSNREYQQARGESLAWLADAQRYRGDLARSIATRQRQVAFLTGLLARGGDVAFRQSLLVAQRSLASSEAERGRIDLALKESRSSIAQFDRLRALEPSNSFWTEIGSNARLDLAGYLLASGSADEAAAQAGESCAAFTALLKRNPSSPEWRSGLRSCWLVKTKLALHNRDYSQALSAARNAIAVARSIKSSDRIDDIYGLVTAYRLLGDAEQALGNGAGAESAWSKAAQLVPQQVAEKPSEMAARAQLLERLGRGADAGRLKAKLHAMGYVEPVFVLR